MAERKSAQQKAQEAVDIAARRVESLERRLEQAEAQVNALKADLVTAREAHDYAGKHPALKQETAPEVQAAVEDDSKDAKAATEQPALDPGF